MAEVQPRDALHPVPHNRDQVATKEIKRIQKKLQNFFTSSESESFLYQILQAQATHSEAGPLRRKAWTRDVDSCFFGIPYFLPFTFTEYNSFQMPTQIYK